MGELLGQPVIGRGPPTVGWHDAFPAGREDGLVWQVSNLQAVGDRPSTHALIEQLSAKGKVQDAAGLLAYRELSRLVAFDAASTLTGRGNPCPAMALPSAPVAPVKQLKKRATGAA